MQLHFPPVADAAVPHFEYTRINRQENHFLGYPRPIKRY